MVDVSGDGANNQGTMVTLARDELLAKGVTINGLPIMLKRPSAATMDIDRLDVYYEDCVIGGPAAFVIPIKERAQFKDATAPSWCWKWRDFRPRRCRRQRQVQGGGELEAAPLSVRVAPSSAEAPRVSCLIGERLWQERWGP